jgi:hypothetical protein
MDILLLKLQRNKRILYTERPTPSLLKEKTPFLNAYMCRREQKSWSWSLRRLKPGMTALAKASSNLTDRLMAE